MKKAVIYARYSSDNQSEQSIEGQIRVCNEYAERNNIMIIDSYIDRAMTGTNDRRPEFQRMISDSSKKEWDYVIVYKLDRFSRDKYETVVHRKTLRDNGIKLLSAMENIPDSPEGIILEGLLESMNQYFSAELSQKTKRGMRENRIKGYSQGGKTLYGYRVENKKIVIDEEEAAVLRYMFERYDAGSYVKDIVAALKARGITKRGQPFAQSTVYRMLLLERYTGVYRYGNEVYENMYPQIIDKELYARIKARSAILRHGKSSVQVTYLLSRKLICGYCGKSINGACGTQRNGTKKFYYRCSGRNEKNSDCPKIALSKELFEKFIIKQVIGELTKPEVMNKLLERILDVQKIKSKANEQLQILERELQQARTSLHNLLKNAEEGLITQTIQIRIKEREEQIAKIEKAISIEKSKICTPVNHEALRKNYAEVLKRNIKEVIGSLIKNIMVYNDKIKITVKTPLKESPDDEQGSFHKTTLQYSHTHIHNEIQTPIEVQYKI